jgi:tetrahydromethanopterin S-methyltransferase subunit B
MDFWLGFWLGCIVMAVIGIVLFVALHHLARIL